MCVCFAESQIGSMPWIGLDDHQWWSYVITALGIWLDIPWMTAVGGAYLSLLWFPCTPEKLFTVIIALFLLKKLFPGDTRTLQVLEQEYAHAKAAIGHLKKKRNHPSK